MIRYSCLLLALGGALISACAIPQQVDQIEREQRRIRSEQAIVQRDLQQEYAALRRDVDSARETLADTRANLQDVQRELGVLKERVEEARFQTDRQLGEAGRAGDQRTRDLEGRLAKIESDLKLQAALLKTREDEIRLLRETLFAARGAKPTPPVVPPPPAMPEVRRPTLPPEELAKRDYDDALALMDQKDYRGGIARFKEFLKKHPKSEYADNAQYWVGEGHYALREFDQAILEFDAVRRQYPTGDKVPAALLKLGFAFAELGDRVDARLILRELIVRYPESEEALKARQKLKTLES
jgi:tol-pal system protein YbgF